MDHKTLMKVIIILAVVHLLLSAFVGVMLYNGSLTTTHAAIFCGVSVVVTGLIAFFSYKCHEESCK